MIPMLDETITIAAESGAHEVVLGMAHRGRLNVLAHTIGMPYEQILREFEGERTIDAVAADPEGGTGDVKYHLGAHGMRTTPSGKVACGSSPTRATSKRSTPSSRARARRADRPLRRRGHPRSLGRAARAAARRRGVRRPGRRR
jgi:2-oxoglutarate dehydrogenase complex, dehydrogenase (E1) component, and related enzymes